MSGFVDGTFIFSVSLKDQMMVKKGFLESAKTHLDYVAVKLGFVVERQEPSAAYPNGVAHWRIPHDLEKKIDGALYCRVAMEHAEWLEDTKENLRKWSKEPPTGETEWLRPEDCIEFWYGLSPIEVPFEKWSREYFIWRMETVYQFLRTGEAEGCNSNGVKPLSVEQADLVIWMISELLHLDRHDVRMSVPKKWRWIRRPGSRGRMVLKQTDVIQPDGLYDGNGYLFCEQCGPILDGYEGTGCPRRKCPVRTEEEG